MASQPCGCAGGAPRQGGHRSGVPPEGRLRGAGEPVDTTPWGAALAGTAVVGAASRLRAEGGDPYVGPTT